MRSPFDVSKIYLRCISGKSDDAICRALRHGQFRMADLFSDEELERAQPDTAAHAPLADRLRPRTLDEVVGQEHLTGPEGAIGRMVAAGKLSSMILWGPPGSGKTSIARLLADAV